MSDFKVGIIGAGVVGLTTALELKNQIRNAEVTIIADKFHRDTTSYVAAGLFRPGTSFRGPTEEVTYEWIRNAYNYWTDIKRTPEAHKAGVKELSGYIFSSTHISITKNNYLEKILPVYRTATEGELKLCPGTWKYGSFYSTILTECDLFLPWVTRKIKELDGKFISQKVDSFSDKIMDFDVIVNCTGMGAKYLCNDNLLVPLRGQVWKVEAPWIKHFFYVDYDTYIIPGFEGVTLGGCRQYDSYNLEVDKYDGLAIKERCESLLPELKNARVIGQRVGLRPHRSVVRVEKEIVMSKGKRQKIVHNYGHGGYGVMVSPGTAIHAVKLIKELWMGHSKL
ncbi:D-aspartate oxidase-like [Agrilus planipennis]|uniref:D-aspartate oxidase-like n=1 Tax=Agrilus planipennis TaxID=224129 RepID=A0A1W4XAG1_AGRPL|nr:D-aspartate oxidase-like [Agrilus planipennis]